MSIKKLIKKHRIFFSFFLLMALFRTAVADWNYVPSGSMEPTLFAGDYVLVNKTAYGPTIPFTDFRLAKTGKPERSDIITFYPPHRDEQFVKRVIGIPGDVIAFQGPDIYVNGQKLAFKPIYQEPQYLSGIEIVEKKSHLLKYSGSSSMPYSREVIIVPDNKYFVLGDHRNQSSDSRYWGFVNEDKVMGKVTHIAVSFSNKRPLSERIGIQLF